MQRKNKVYVDSSSFYSPKQKTNKLSYDLDRNDFISNFTTDVEDRLKWFTSDTIGENFLATSNQRKNFKANAQKNPSLKFYSNSTFKESSSTSRSNSNNQDDDDDDDDDESNNDDSDNIDDDDEEEVVLGNIIIPPSQQQELTIQIKSQINILVEQCKEFKSKHEKLYNDYQNMEINKKELQLHIDTLQQENQELQQVLEDVHKSKNLTSSTSIYSINNSNKQHNLNNRKQYNYDNNMKRAEEIRQALINEEDSDIHVTLNSKLVRNGAWLHALISWLNHIMPFKHTIREVQARFGASVASYFVFYRWMFMNFFWIAAVTTIFLILHLYSLVINNQVSTIYTSNGYLPGFMFISTYSTSEKLQYTLTILFGAIFMTISCIKKWLSEDRLRKELLSMSDDDSYTISKEVFCIWDNSMITQQDAKELSGSLSHFYIQKLHEITMKGKVNKRSKSEIAWLYSRRIFGNFLYLCVQLVSFVLIVYLTIKAQSIKNDVNNISNHLQFLSGFIVPVAITAINTITPSLLKLITAFEKWDSGDIELDILLFRMYLSNTLNLLLLAFTYALLANPFVFASENYYTFRVDVEPLFQSTVYPCRLDQTASGLFNLVITDVVIKQLLFLVNGLVPYAKRWHTKKLVKTEFHIATNMVSVLYSAGLLLLLFPFAPLSIVIMPLMLAMKITFQKYVLLLLYSKPKKPWKAQKAGAVFTLFYMSSVVLVAWPSILFFLSSRSFAKSCSVQDYKVNLCVSSTFSDSTNSCELDSNSKYYHYFSDSGRCSTGYPSCICNGEMACGPFIDDTTAFVNFTDVISQTFILNKIWTFLFTYTYGPWILVVILFVFSRMLYNDYIVYQNAAREREKSMETNIIALEAEKAKQEKLIKKLKAIKSFK